MSAYTPTKFYKSGEPTETAYSWSEHYQLLWDGYTPGNPIPPEDQLFSQSQADYLAERFAPTTAVDGKQDAATLDVDTAILASDPLTSLGGTLDSRFLKQAAKGVAGGVAALDAGGKVPEAAVPSRLAQTTLEELFLKRGEALDSARARVSVSTSYHINTSPAYHYEVVRVRTGGAPIAGLVENIYAYDYEKDWVSGTPFAPVREPLTDFYARTGHDFLFDSGALATGADGSPIVGVSIKDGVIYHDFETSTGQQGTDAMGFRADGTSKLYSARWGDSAASMVADGVTEAFSFGPALVRDGVPEDLEANPQWGIWNTEDSARTLLGTTPTGDVIVVFVHGKSGDYGIRGNENVAVMVRHGCHNAIMLDGGGSTSFLVNGEHGHISSDASGVRPAQSCIGIRARVTNQVDTGWVDVPYVSGFTYGADSWRQLKVRRIGERVMFTGRAVGSLPAGAWTTVGTLPKEFVPAIAAVGTGSGGSGKASGQISILPNDRAVQIQPSVTTTNMDLTGVTYRLL